MNDRSPTCVPPRRFFGLALLAMLAACSSGSGNEAAPAGAEAAEGTETTSEAAGPAAAPGRVSLSEAAARTARIETEAVRSEAAAATGMGGLQIPGQVDFDPARLAVVSARTGGRIERLAAVPGSRVRAGQTVALLTSREYLTAQTDLLQAARRAELLAGTADEAGARSLLEAARRRLRLLGAGSEVIGRLERGGEPALLLAVPAPFAGSILETLAPAGSAVEAGTPIFRIADLSTVLIAADVPERALPSVWTGERAVVRLAAYPDRTFAGRVERLGDTVDPETRTVDAFIRVPNPDRALRPGMFATVGIDVPENGQAEAGSVLTVPASAIVTEGAARYAFVEIGPRTYERRAVEIGSAAVAGGGPAGSRAVVTSGLRAGERVVSRGAFTLKSELAKASLVDDD